jgi:polysaccharide biosynthesis transport protein
LERQKIEFQQLGAKSVEYTALDRAATANRLLLDNLEQRSRQVSLARDVPTASMRMLDPAQVPDVPILPREQRNLLLAIIGAAFFAFTVVFLRELLHTRMTSPDDVKRHLRIPVLGVTPQLDSIDSRASMLLDATPPRFVELLYGLRTNLVLAPELATARALLVTSAESGEGKTMAAANLAVSLARLGQHVLLIDADLRNPRMHEMFGVERKPGLADLMTDLRAGVVADAFRSTNIAGLWVLPSGNVSANAADLLGTDQFRSLINQLRGMFDWIVLDSPPVLAVTDACLIARVASAVLFVVESGKTPRDLASAAVERLEAVGATIVGAVLNRAHLDRSGNSYLPYYNRDYPAYSAPPPETTFSFVRPDKS